MDAKEILSEGCMSIAEAVNFSTICRAKLYQEMAAGRLPYILKGSRRIIPKAGLIKYLADGLVKPGDKAE